MMSRLEDLYQEIILEHSRSPHNFGPLKERTHFADGRNPLCGDEISVSLRLADSEIETIRFQGQACAIAKASASIMTDQLNGLTKERAVERARAFLRSIHGESAGALPEGNEVGALIGIKRFPSRIKCATLPWRAFLAAIDGKSQASSEGVEGSVLE